MITPRPGRILRTGLSLPLIWKLLQTKPLRLPPILRVVVGLLRPQLIPAGTFVLLRVVFTRMGQTIRLPPFLTRWARPPFMRVRTATIVAVPLLLLRTIQRIKQRLTSLPVLPLRLVQSLTVKITNVMRPTSIVVTVLPLLGAVTLPPSVVITRAKVIRKKRQVALVGPVTAQLPELMPKRVEQQTRIIAVLLPLRIPVTSLVRFITPHPLRRTVLPRSDMRHGRFLGRLRPQKHGPSLAGMKRKIGEEALTREISHATKPYPHQHPNSPSSVNT